MTELQLEMDFLIINNLSVEQYCNNISSVWHTMYVAACWLLVFGHYYFPRRIWCRANFWSITTFIIQYCVLESNYQEETYITTFIHVYIFFMWCVSTYCITYLFMNILKVVTYSFTSMTLLFFQFSFYIINVKPWRLHFYFLCIK